MDNGVSGSATSSKILTHLAPLPPQLTLTSITTPAHVASLKRLNSLLLPVAYPDSFYRELLADNTVGKEARSVSRLAWWEGVVVGGVRGRVEDVENGERGEAEGTGTERRRVKVYIMTLGVLAPFRGLGVGGRLVNWLMGGGDGGRGGEKEGGQGWIVEEVYAHVWEKNEEALEWYAKRGFLVGEEVLEGYYRKLKPGGAKVVKWRLSR
ncbi:hypothetical protein BDZ91DRAFT_846171 [Kalaharituber pfeilii]|nr:hypothetical protein BDZ91DRAFT_846171 [Kalaharituber pfeilii]